MNAELELYARASLKRDLPKLPSEWQLLFKKMYSHLDTTLPIDNVVDSMPKEKLDWAMQQVANSFKKLHTHEN